MNLLNPGSSLILSSTSRVELPILFVQPEPHWGKSLYSGFRFRSWSSIYLWDTNYLVLIGSGIHWNMFKICTVHWWLYWMQMDSLKCVTCHLQLLNANAIISFEIIFNPNLQQFQWEIFFYPGGHLDCHHWRSWPFGPPSSTPTFKDKKESCTHTSNPRSLLSYLSPWNFEH